MSVDFYRDINPTEPAHLNATGEVYNPASSFSQQYPTDQALSTALIHSYGGSALTNIFGAPITWPKDLSMMQWARAVMDYFNRDIPRTSNGSTWSSRQDLFFFDAAVNYFKKFNYRYQYTQDDCELLSEMIPAVDQEITSVTQRHAAGNFGNGELSQYMTVLDALKQKMATDAATLNCSSYLANANQQQVLGNQLSAFQAAGSVAQGSKLPQYIIWGAIGLVVLLSSYLILRKKKK